MKALPLLLLTITLLLYSCADQSPTNLIPMQEIKGRDYHGKRFNVYRARMPLNWIRRDSLPDESLQDTKKAITEFLILNYDDSENIQHIRITIHNFPSEKIEQRIPPAAQISRWQRQFEFIRPEESAINPQAFSGYSGLKFKAVGKIKEDPTEESMMLGWTLQLDKEHYRMLSHPTTPAENNLYREMRADVTIKVTGPKELMEAHEEEINDFARSFELIKEIPART